MTKLNDQIKAQQNVVWGIDPKKDAFFSVRRTMGIKQPVYTKNADAARPPQYVAPPSTYNPADKSFQARQASAADASAYMTGIDKALGIQSPVDTRKTMRRAAMTQLNQGAHAQDVAEAARLQQMGAVGSPLELALQGRRATELAGQKAQTVADIEQDFANRQGEFDRQRRTGAMQAGRDMTDFSRFSASDAENRARYADTMAQQNAMTEYEYNQLFPYQVRQANEMAKLQALEQKKANRLGYVMSGVNAAANVGGAFLGGM